METLLLAILLQTITTTPSVPRTNFDSLNAVGYRVCSFSGLHNNEYVQKGDDSIVSKIENKIFLLPEVQRKQKLVDSISHHKHGVSIMVIERPNKTGKYYWIAVGYSSEIRFETMFNFYVWSSPMVIKYFDTDKGKELTLAQWRKSGVYFD